MVKKQNATTTIKAELPTESSAVSLKKGSCTVTRRSGRIRNQNPALQNHEIQPIVQIDVIEDEMAYDGNADEEPVLNGKSLEEKIDYIIQTVDELKSKDTRGHSQDDVPPTDLTYRSLYFDSQKKIETLMKENYELSKKAEAASGKLEGYGEASHVWSEMFKQAKDMVMVSNLPKATTKDEHTSSLANTNDLATLPKEINETNGVVETQPSAKRNKKAKTKKNK